MFFVTYLATLNLSYPTIKVYLSTVGSLHTSSGYHNDFNAQLTPRLQQVLKGFRKEKAAHYHSTHNEANKKLKTFLSAVNAETEC